jgi:23S rRNA (cytosine1962-C5)-methyltransferase
MVPAMPSVVLKSGHVQPVWSGHPWIYSQAVDRVEGGATPGDEVSVVDPRGNFLGTGFYSPRSAIVVRLATRNPKTKLDAAWLRHRLSQAHEVRHEMGLPTARTNGFRLVHSEGDQLPGLVVDRFNDVAAVQLTTIGMQRRRAMVIDAIQGVFGVRGIVDRTPGTYAKTEGFEPEPGVVRGPKDLDAYRFVERGFAYEIPMEIGQKTGFYFDQRPLRARVEQLSRGRRVLDAFCFVGSFGLAAARGGAASVLAVDENVIALETGARCAAANGFADRIAFSRGSVRDVLNSSSHVGKFDLVVLDPPSMAPSQKSLNRARKTFRWLVAQGCRVLRPGGLMVISACSAAVDLEALTRALAVGARDAGNQAVVLERWFQGADHPVPAAFSEGLYLKSLIARIEPV